MFFRRLLYKDYRFVSGTVYWFRKRFTKAACLVLIGLGVSAAFGVDTNQTTAYQAFTFILCLFICALIWSMILSRRKKRIFTAHRILPRFATVGAPVAYTVVIGNQTSRIYSRLAFRENLPDPRPSLKEFLNLIEPKAKKQSLLDRLFWYPRWEALVLKKQLAVMKERPLPHLGSYSEVQLQVDFIPARRGKLNFMSLTVIDFDLFGLFKLFHHISIEQSLLILPKRYLLPQIDLPGTRIYQQGGVTLASAVGESDEFISLRDYRPGDPLRHIHWRSWAKLSKPIVKEYQDEFFVRHALILDTFADQSSDAVFEEAVSVAASFACTIQTQDSLLDLMFVGAQAYCFTAGRGVGHTEKMLEILASVSLCHDKPFISLQHTVLSYLSSVSGCICILLDWDDERKKFIELLISLGMPVQVFVITDGDLETLDSGPMKNQPASFHHLQIGKIQEELLKL